MNSEERLRNKIGSEAGFKVPEGFFDATYSRIAAELPERTAPKPVELSRWQRLKPYVYLAAMFAGIWCTLKMVTMMTDSAGLNTQVSLENPPGLIAQAMTSPEVAESFLPEAPSPVEADFADVIADVDIDPATDAAPEAQPAEVSLAVEEPDYDYYDIDLNELRAELDRTDDYDTYDF